jgi:anti-anti-sigma regulatory factor
MGTRNWPEDIIIVKLPAEPQTSDELQAVIKISHDRLDRDLIVDFSNVDTISCLSLCNLMKLHRILSDHGRRLILYNVTPATRDSLHNYAFNRIFELASDTHFVFKSPTQVGSGGILELRTPYGIEPHKRRNYVRLNICELITVSVLFWHRRQNEDKLEIPWENCWQGWLIDISEGGAQIAIDPMQKPNLKKSHFIRLQFARIHYKNAPMFDAQIREVLPSADNRSVCVGVQFSGLEENLDGRRYLKWLCNSEERYFETKEFTTA